MKVKFPKKKLFKFVCKQYVELQRELEVDLFKNNSQELPSKS